jgi:catechol 2,3-dioxygenase
VTTVNQVSFKVPDLDALKTVFGRARAAGIENIRQTCHGNALSCYFPDPEGNMNEIYIDTPWYVPQPRGVAIDLTLANDEIIARNNRHCRETFGFMSLNEWRAEVTRRLGRTCAPGVWVSPGRSPPSRSLPHREERPAE